MPSKCMHKHDLTGGFYSTYFTTVSFISVWSHKMLWTGHLKQQTLTSHSSGGRDVQGQGTRRTGVW